MSERGSNGRPSQGGGERPGTEGLFTLARLAEAAGVPPRTIRFYITRGLLPPPRKRGRQAAYGPEHVERLSAIKKLQAEGLSLPEISAVLEQPRVHLPQPESWLLLRLAPDFVVWIPGGVGGYRKRQLLAAVQKAAEVLAAASGKEEDHGNR